MLFSQRAKWDTCTAPDCNNTAVATIHAKDDFVPRTQRGTVLIFRVCRRHLERHNWITLHRPANWPLTIEELQNLDDRRAHPYTYKEATDD
ncbi:hypothetical protein [Nesterenkonia rhizosphaerae]|uniref:Acetone carboxylase n=1 Tax=Nesterenkonia rhizosphaerae TaxID=1348272 RepID=A0ABP9FW24_9MICC